MEKYLIGVDVGTTGTKSILLSEKGETVAHAYEGYKTFAPDTLTCEQDAEALWGAVVRTVRRVCEAVADKEKVAGIRCKGHVYLSTCADYSGSCGFLDLNGNNCYYMCYSDQFSNGFRFGERAFGSILDSCMCYWYSSEGDTKTAIRCDGQFRSAVTNIKVGFRAAVSRAVLSAVRPGGKGYLQNICLCHGGESLLGDASFRDYLRGTVL